MKAPGIDCDNGDNCDNCDNCDNYDGISTGGGSAWKLRCRNGYCSQAIGSPI